MVPAGKPDGGARAEPVKPLAERMSAQPGDKSQHQILTASHRQSLANQAAEQSTSALSTLDLLRPQAPRLSLQQPSASAQSHAHQVYNGPNSGVQPRSIDNYSKEAVDTFGPRYAPQQLGASSSETARSQQQPLRPTSALYNSAGSNPVHLKASNPALSSGSLGSSGTISTTSLNSSLPSLQSPRPGASVRSPTVTATPARPMSARSLFASSGSSSQSRRTPVGLQNLGNTCFMNAVLQSLFASEPFISYFLDGNYQRDAPTTHSPLTAAFVRLLENVWGPGSRAVSVIAPDAVKSQLGRKNPIFQGYSQQDSHELLRIFLDDIHEELSRAKQPCPYSFDDGKEHERSLGENASRMWQNFLARNGSIVSDMFTGQFCSTVICGTCGYTSNCFDPFMDLSVPLPKAPAPSTSWGFFGSSSSSSSISKSADLMDCLNIMFGKEELSGADAWYTLAPSFKPFTPSSPFICLFYLYLFSFAVQVLCQVQER